MECGAAPEPGEAFEERLACGTGARRLFSEETGDEDCREQERPGEECGGGCCGDIPFGDESCGADEAEAVEGGVDPEDEREHPDGVERQFGEGGERGSGKGPSAEQWWKTESRQYVHRVPLAANKIVTHPQWGLLY